MFSQYCVSAQMGSKSIKIYTNFTKVTPKSGKYALFYINFTMKNKFKKNIKILFDILYNCV